MCLSGVEEEAYLQAKERQGARGSPRYASLSGPCYSKTSHLLDLAQVEDYLKEVTKNAEDENENAESSVTSKDTESQNVDYDFATEQPAQRRPPQGQAEVPFEIPDFTTGLDGDNIFGDAQLMDLGITETLPPFEVMEEL